MAFGILGLATVPSATPAAIYTVPETLVGMAVANISIVNTDQTNATNVTVKVNSIPIEDTTFLPPSEGIGRSCGALSPGDVIEVTSFATNVDVVINGIETIGANGGTLASGEITTGQNVTYTAPDSASCSYVLVDFNVVNEDPINDAIFTVTIDGISIESNTKKIAKTGLFRAVGPISPLSVLAVTCVSGSIAVRISGKIF